MSEIKESIITRITKLLALSESRGATEAEAAVASQKVQEILQAHGLSLAEVEAAGGKSSGDDSREKRVIRRGAMYAWQRKLMETLAQTNFCFHRIHEERDEETGRKSKRHQVIGRVVNVMATQITYDYLLSAIKRLVREAGYRPGTHNERDYHFWLEGCAERLCERLRDKAIEAQRESERKEKERKAAASHPAYAGNTSNALVLSDVYSTEEDFNRDFLNGWEPGTTARQRREAAAKEAAREAEYRRLIAMGVEEIEAYYRSHGYGIERSKELAADYHKPSRSRPSRARSGGSSYRYTNADRREDEKRSSTAFRQGTQAGSDIGLDKQVDEKRKGRISNG